MNIKNDISTIQRFTPTSNKGSSVITEKDDLSSEIIDNPLNKHDLTSNIKPIEEINYSEMDQNKITSYNENLIIDNLDDQIARISNIVMDID